MANGIEAYRTLMSRRWHMFIPRLILICLVLSTIEGIASADVYIWTDEDGTVHIQNYGKPRHVKEYERLAEPPSRQRGKKRSTSEPDPAAPAPSPGPATDSVAVSTDVFEALLKGTSQDQDAGSDWIDILFKGYNLLKRDSDNGKSVPQKPPDPPPPAKPTPKGSGGNWLTTRPE